MQMFAPLAQERLLAQPFRLTVHKLHGHLVLWMSQVSQGLRPMGWMQFLTGIYLSNSLLLVLFVLSIFPVCRKI